MPAVAAAEAEPVRPTVAVRSESAQTSDERERERTSAPNESPAGETRDVRGVTLGGAPVTPGAIGLELGAPNRFAGSAAEAPGASGAGEGSRDERDARGMKPRTTAETKAAVEAALREPARARERELGLGPEGPVLKALGEATEASAAPVTGRAVFVAVADRTGMIVGIDVVDCDGGRNGWAEAAELARAALKGKKLRVPSTATGAEMRIEITSAWKLPSGHDPGADVTVFGAPVAKGEGKQSTKVAILDPIPKLRADVIEVMPGLKIPVVSVNIDILSVQGDPANIGSKPRRIVHTRLIDSKVR